MLDQATIDEALASFKNCQLCPHACGVDRTAGKRGVCGADARMFVARVAPHYWEEPCISGVSGSGTIFFSHCNLGCLYCQNYEISARKHKSGSATKIEKLALQCLRLQKTGVLNINFVTPTHYAPLIRLAIANARELGLELPIVWNTGGYETPEAICTNTGFVDVYLSDFKYMDTQIAEALSGAPDYAERAIAALDAMVEQAGKPRFDEYREVPRMVSGVMVRHMMLPGNLDDSKNIIEMLHSRYGDNIKLSIMNQYTPVLTTRAATGDVQAQEILSKYPQLAEKVSDNDYELLLDFADDLGIDDYYWQTGETALESFIPSFH